MLVSVGLGMGLSAVVLAGPSYVALPTALFVSRMDNAGLQVGWALRNLRQEQRLVTGALALLPVGIAGMRHLVDDPEAKAKSVAQGIVGGVAGGVSVAARVMRGQLAQRRAPGG